MILLRCNRLEAIPLFPLQKLHWFDLYFSAPVRLLIVLRQPIQYEPDTFPRSDNSIFAFLPLGACCKPVSLNAPVTHYGLS